MLKGFNYRLEGVQGAVLGVDLLVGLQLLQANAALGYPLGDFGISQARGLNPGDGRHFVNVPFVNVS